MFCLIVSFSPIKHIKDQQSQLAYLSAASLGSILFKWIVKIIIFHQMTLGEWHIEHES